MSWCGIEGHDDVVNRFRTSLQRGRLASTFLFVGKSGIGKKKFARRFAQALLCSHAADEELAPCLQCDSCLQIEAGSHPDVEQVNKPVDKSTIPIELFIGDLKNRNKDGLCYRLALRPSIGDRRIAIIDDADFMNQEGANCLLKTLEEPPPRSILILLATSEQRQLPTIRSRCQTVRFQPLSLEFVTQHLREINPELSEADAAERAWLGEGSLDQALEFVDPELEGFRCELWESLGSAAQTDYLKITKDISTFVDSAGKEAPKRRQRLRHTIRLFMLFYRQLMLTSFESSTEAKGLLGKQAQAAQRAGQGEATPVQIDRCLQALREVDANANLATLIECWIDDVAAAQLGTASLRR